MISENEGHARMSTKKVAGNLVDLCNMNLILELAGFIVGCGKRNFLHHTLVIIDGLDLHKTCHLLGFWTMIYGS